jgi:L-alanine-DL-glutamate epimerase-like enolase superfamily enzyme
VAELDRLAPAAPFTATAFRTAAEMAWRHPLLFSPGERRIPLLAIVNAVEAEHIAAEVEARLAEGYRTLKIKVGFEADSDLARVRFIQGLVAGTATALTIDANQGYRREEGCAFAARLQPDNIQFFEQACHKNDWDAAVAVARASTVPVMLDESIYGLEDVERAAALGAAHYVKLKLMKLGGLDRLTAAIDRVTQLGLTPVLGNGVATDIGCWMEAAVAHGRLSTAGEMNGFLKPAKGLLANGLRVESGDLVIPAHWSPRYDAQTLAACCVATAGEPMPTSAA